MSNSTTITKPDMKADINGYVFNWPELGINVSVERLDDEGVGELTFRHINGKEPVTLHRARTNLLSTQSCTQLSNRLKKQLPVDWDTILTYIGCMAMDHMRQGEQAITIGLGEDIPPRNYVINPLLPEGEATVIYGEPKSGKSYVSLLVCLGVVLPWRDNPFGWSVPARPLKPLLLDWESGPETLDRRVKRLARGMMGTVQVPIDYLRCSLALLDDLDNIKKEVGRISPDLLVIDSIGMASGGDLNSPESAKGLWRGIRQLGVKTVLLIGHSAKNMTGRTSIFGSQFYTAEARNIWEAKRVQEVEDDTIHVALFHKCANDERLNKPIGLKLRFDPDATVVEPADVEDIAGMSEEVARQLPASVLIKHALAKGATTAKELADQTGIAEGTVKTNLTRLRDRGIVQQRGSNQWGLSYHES